MQIEIGSYGLNYIKSKARKLVIEYGFSWSDFEDLQQEMLLDLIQRLPKFDPNRSPRNAFITRVVNNKMADIITRRLSPSQEHVRNEISINTPLEQDGRPVELVNTLCDSQKNDERISLAMDLKHVLPCLPHKLRFLADLLLEHSTIAEISRITGIPETTLKDRRRKLRQHLERAGLGKYFE